MIEGVADADEPKRHRGRPRSKAAAAAVLDAAYRLAVSEGLRGATIQAIADESAVSKMTIYKWWDSRLPLLIDAYLRQASTALPLSATDPPVRAIQAHAERYLKALQGDLGRVQRAVLAACVAEHGDAGIFVERYLNVRRGLGVRVIRRGQRDGSIRSRRPAEDLYDQIYGTIFYRHLFGLPGLNAKFVRTLIALTFSDGTVAKGYDEISPR